MRNSKVIVFIIFILMFSCKPKHQFTNGFKLPAYQDKNEVEILKSIINSSNYQKFQELIVNGKKYPAKELQNILDTISPNYKIVIKKDSVLNKKILILNNSKHGD